MPELNRLNILRYDLVDVERPTEEKLLLLYEKYLEEVIICFIIFILVIVNRKSGEALEIIKIRS